MRCVVGWLVSGLFLAMAAEAMAAGEVYRLASGDTIRLRVMEWREETGRFEMLNGVDGEYPVNEDGTVTVPLGGRMEAEGLSTAELGEAISVRLQERLRSAEPPDAAVAVAAYRPVYVVGDVERAGSYPFVPDLSAAQVLALAGGPKSPAGEANMRQLLSDLGNLEDLSREFVRARAREVRLLAEVEDRAELRFPEGLAHPDGGDATALMLSEEEDIFVARRAALERELESLSDLKGLLETETATLEAKLLGQERQLALVRETLSGIEDLVERGFAANVRLTDAQRNLIDLESRELDIETALFRARQRISETERDAIALRARYRTEATEELQRVRSQIEGLTSGIKITKALLLDTGVAGATISTEATAHFTVRRRGADGESEIAIAPSALLRPGDVLEVTVELDGLAAVPLR